MKNYWMIVNEVIDKSDVVLEVVDARFPEGTRNAEVEQKVIEKGKKLIIVLNKCDLVPKKMMEKAKKEIKNSIFVSANDRLGTTMLKTRILELGRTEKIMVGVVGYPNTGKSSIINAIAGRSKAKTSSESGYTKGKQLVRAGRIMMLDTPGVIPFMENDPMKHAIIAATDFTRVKDPMSVVYELIMTLNGRIERHYDIQPSDDAEETLERIALKNNKIKKGGTANSIAMAREILKDWQRGLIP